MDITKEELVELIKSTITTMNAEPSKTEEVVVNQDNEPAKEESKEEKKTEETPKEEPEKKDVSQSETAKAEEETPKTEPEKDAKASEKDDEPEKKDEEVIKEEVLNSAPTTTVPKVEEEWRNLKGEEFRKWCAEHAHYCNTYRGE